MARFISHPNPILIYPDGSGVSFEPVDIRKFNLNKMWDNYKSHKFNNNVNETSFGVTYQDSWDVEWKDQGVFYSSKMLGKNMTVSKNAFAKSGVVESYVEYKYAGKPGGPITTKDPMLQIDKFSISATALDAAASTIGTADDKKILKLILSKADVAMLSSKADYFKGYGGNDKIYGKKGNDKLFGDYGHDKLDGGEGADTLNGGFGNDTLLGKAGNDTMNGGRHNDTLKGSAGADKMTGALGRDKMFAGKDKAVDQFFYNGTADSRVGATVRDKIYQFDSGEDKINLAKIDANTSAAGDQAFGFSVSGAAANSIWFTGSGTSGVVNGDVNGDKIADFQIEVVNVLSFLSTDFVL